MARKLSKALEKLAREVKDSDEFVTHIAGICERYRREQALEGGPRAAAVRQQLKAFRRHAQALSEWLQQAQKASPATPQFDAVSQFGPGLAGTAIQARAESANIRAWLDRAEKAAAACLAERGRTARRGSGNAPRVAAEALRATFEHHKLKLSTSVSAKKQGDAVRLLCAVAKAAGDPDLSPEVAGQLLRGQPA